MKTQAATILVDAMVLNISEHGGPVPSSRYRTEESPPIRAGPLGDYMFEIQHQQEENVLISGTREKSAVGDSAEPKQ